MYLKLSKYLSDDKPRKVLLRDYKSKLTEFMGMCEIRPSTEVAVQVDA